MGTAIGELVPKNTLSLDALSGKRIGIDAFNIIYQFLSSIRGADGTPLSDSRGNVTSHLTGLLYRTANLVERGIRPVFVFDGAPHPLKAQTIAARKEVRDAAREKHETALAAGDMEDARKFGSRALHLTDDMVKDAKHLLGALGFPVVEAPQEGEAQISRMCAKGDLYGCASQDLDALLFGTPRLLRNIAVGGKRKVPGKSVYRDVAPEEIVLSEALEALGITRQKLVWLGMLIGTDFNEKFPRVGPKTALKLVQEHDTFEGIVEKTGHEPGFDYREIERIFLEPEWTREYGLDARSPDREAVESFLCDGHDFSRERVQSAVDKIARTYDEQGKQKSISQWFG